MPKKYTYLAGIYEQCMHEPCYGDECVGAWRLVVRSRHTRRDLAERAARRYQRERQQSTGGAYSWSAWYRPIDAPPAAAVEIKPYHQEVEEYPYLNRAWCDACGVAHGSGPTRTYEPGHPPPPPRRRSSCHRMPPPHGTLLAKSYCATGAPSQRQGSRYATRGIWSWA